MNSRGVTWKSVVLTFVLAVVFYLLAYNWMMKRQTGKGPWQVGFTTTSDGTPQISMNHSLLGITNVMVQFPGESLGPSNTTGSVSFAKPRLRTPFGRVAYDDLMFQPGVVVLDCFGHLIEMAPRTLGLNGQAVGWSNGVTHTLVATNKLSSEARKGLKGGYR
jgi:hypothetical protein